MHVTILHDAVTSADQASDLDILLQVDVVHHALKSLGHRVDRLEFGLDLDRLSRSLRRQKPDLVFNLVESLSGHAALIDLAPAMLEDTGILYTGCGRESIFLTTNKLLCKRLLRNDKLSTPDWSVDGHDAQTGRWIVKSVREHASYGIDASSVTDSAVELAELIAGRSKRLGGDWFAEQYIAGREFNVAILADGDKPQVLPIAEIQFRDFGDSRPHIVDYRAKWLPESFEYQNTVRNFHWSDPDGTLQGQLVSMATRCWELFDCQGYIRVDFRVDDNGVAWILEVNANPCLSPDAGFAASLERAGIGFNQAVARILDAARPANCTIDMAPRHALGARS